jgi:hypothetical protein
VGGVGDSRLPAPDNNLHNGALHQTRLQSAVIPTVPRQFLGAHLGHSSAIEL